MSTIGNGIIGIMSEKMGYLTQKQAVHAQNIANANTPGYKAKEITAFTFGDAIKETEKGMRTTNAMHIIPASMAGANAGTGKAKSYETVPSGNSVDLEQQMLEVSKTTMDYQATSSIMHKFMSMLRSALGSR